MTRKDIEYKDKLKILGYKKIENNGYKNKYYTPDIVFQKKGGTLSDEEVVIVEQSSNGMKKVHIAELTQFIELAMSKKKSNQKFIFLLILTQKKENTPKNYLEIEVKRLSFYIDSLFSKILKEKLQNIKGLYIVEDCDGELLTLDKTLDLSDVDDKIAKINFL